MGTGTSRRRRSRVGGLTIGGLAALTLAVAGCGGSSSGASSSGASASASSGGTGRTSTTATAGSVAQPAGFAWLRPGPAPSGWSLVRISTGSTLPYPPGWRLAKGDAGTATAVLSSSGQPFIGYLNLTPKQGDESLSTWIPFRLDHNAEDGDNHVVKLAAATGLPFRNGRGSCVRDAYTTKTGAKFIELACLVAGPHATSVIVGAAPPQHWAQVSPLLERAISAFTA